MPSKDGLWFMVIHPYPSHFVGIQTFHGSADIPMILVSKDHPPISVYQFVYQYTVQLLTEGIFGNRLENFSSDNIHMLKTNSLSIPRCFFSLSSPQGLEVLTVLSPIEIAQSSSRMASFNGPSPPPQKQLNRAVQGI